MFEPETRETSAARSAPAGSGEGLPRQPADRPVVVERRAGQRPLVDPAVLLSSLWRHRLLVAGTTLAGAVLGVMMALATPHEYAATALLYIDPREMRTTDPDSGSQLLPTDAMLAMVDSQVEILSSTNVLQDVIADLDLVDDAELNGSLDTGGVAALFGALSGLLGSEEDDDGARNRVVLNNLRDSVAVSRDPRTFIINVSAYTGDPEKSAAVANSIVDNYLTNEANARSGLMERTSEVLSGRIEQLRQDLDRAERAVERFKSDNGIVGASGELIGDNRLLGFAERLTEVQTERVGLEARAEAVSSVDVDDILSGALPEGVDSDTMTSLRSEYASLLSQSDSLATRLGPRHPQLIALQSSLEAVRGEIRNELLRLDAAAQTELRRVRGTEAELSAQLKVLTDQQLASGVDAVALRELERKAAATRQIYEDFLLRARQASEQQNILLGNVRVISDAQAPLLPSGTSRKLIAIAATLVGALAGLAYAGAVGVFESFSGRPFRWNNVLPTLQTRRRPVPGPVPQQTPPLAVAAPKPQGNGIGGQLLSRFRRSDAGKVSPMSAPLPEAPVAVAPAPTPLASETPSRDNAARPSVDEELEQLRERMRLLRERAAAYSRMGA